MILFLVSFFVCFSCLSFDEDAAFVPLDTSKYLQVKRENIINVGAYRDQDGVGICYSFTFAKMVEHICNSSKSCDSKGVDLSTLAISKINDDSLMKFDGGYSLFIMENLRQKSREDRFRFTTEECLPFSKLLYSFEDKYQKSQGQGLKLFRKVFDDVLNIDCIDCIAESSEMLKASLPDLSIEEFQLNNILIKLKKNNISNNKQELKLFRAFVDEVLTNNKCFRKESTVKVPKFKLNSYTNRSIKSSDSFNDKIVSLIDKNQLVELSVCFDRKYDKGQLSCSAPHGIVVNGYRNRCDFNGNCRYELKVTNSWGASWQDKNNDGWVDANNLYLYASGIPGYDKDTGEVLFKAKPQNQVFMTTLFNSNSKDVEASAPIINEIMSIGLKNYKVITQQQDAKPESYKEHSVKESYNKFYICSDENGNTAIVDSAGSSSFKGCREMK